MKITICNSVRFFREAVEVKAKLEEMGHQATTHPMSVYFRGQNVHVMDYYTARKNEWNEEIEELKGQLMRDHFEKIRDSDAVLVINLDKDGKKNYIGGNTFLEMGVAFALGKKIFVLNAIPEDSPYREELKGLRPIVLNGDLKGIDAWLATRIGA